MLQRLDHGFGRTLATQTLRQQRVATASAVGVQVDGRGDVVDAGTGRQRQMVTLRAISSFRACCAQGRPRECFHRCRRRPSHGPLVHHHRWRLLTAADARRRDHAHLGPQDLRQTRQQIARPGHLARQAVAHPNGQRRCCGHGAIRALAHDVEVVIKARHLVDLGLRQAHALGQRRQVRRAELPEAVVEDVQVLDQQITPGRKVHLPEQSLQIGQGRWLHAPALGRLALA